MRPAAVSKPLAPLGLAAACLLSLALVAPSPLIRLAALALAALVLAGVAGAPGAVLARVRATLSGRDEASREVQRPASRVESPYALPARVAVALAAAARARRCPPRRPTL